MSSPLRSLPGRYGAFAIVTGASDGIGRAMAAELGRAGMNLVIVARRGDRLAALAAELSAAHGVEVRPLAVDLATPDGPAAVLAATAGLDVGLLVAAAGFGSSGPVTAADPAEEARMIDLNCRALFVLAQEMSRRMVARGRGGIVLLSSIVAFQGVRNSANYAATKAYVQTLAEGMAGELAPHGVDVLAVAPGPVATGFAARANMTMSGASDPASVALAALAALGRKRTVFPGLRSAVLGQSLGLLPRRLRSFILGTIMTKMANASHGRGTHQAG